MYMNYSGSHLKSQHINPEIKNVVGQISTFRLQQAKLNNTFSTWNTGQSYPTDEKWQQPLKWQEVEPNWHLIYNNVFLHIKTCYSPALCCCCFFFVFFTSTPTKVSLQPFHLCIVSICENPDTMLLAQMIQNLQWESICL